MGNYVVVNVSSPNTPGLRALQTRASLRGCLTACRIVTKPGANTKGTATSALLKIAPDLQPHELDDIVEAVQTCALDGIIATNTTTGREG